MTSSLACLQLYDMLNLLQYLISLSVSLFISVEDLHVKYCQGKPLTKLGLTPVVTHK